MKRSARLYLTLLLLLCASAISSHDHWLNCSTTSSGETPLCVIEICSGHSFPESELKLKGGLITSQEIITPGKAVFTYDSEEGDKSHKGSFALPEKGTYIVTFALKKPQMEKSLFTAKAIILFDPEDSDPACYELGKGLEIVPEQSLCKIEKGQKIEFSLKNDGVTIKGTLTIVHEDGTSMIIRTSAKKTAAVVMKKTGTYKISGSSKGNGSTSLTFNIPEFAKRED